MNILEHLTNIAKAVFVPGDPVAYVCLALVVCILTLGAVSVWGRTQIAVHGVTLEQGLMGVALWLALGLIVLAIVRVIRKPPKSE